MRVAKNQWGIAIFAIAVIAMGMLVAASGPPTAPARSVSVQQLLDACDGAIANLTASSRLDNRLVSVRQLPEGEMCAWEEDPAAADRNLIASLQQGSRLFAPRPILFAALQRGRPVRSASEATTETARLPVRTIRDLNPTYSAIAVDLNSNEVVLQDNNLWSYRVFNRLDNTPPGVEMTEPKRLVQGENTALQFNNGLYIDPKNGDIYSVESDTGDKLVVFPREANGNVAPKHILRTPHRVYNISVDEQKSELYVTVEYPPEVVIYRKGASGDEQPLRRIQGDNSGLDAPHGIAVDEKNQLLYINNWGHHSNFRIPGTGRYEPPSIKVYPLSASGGTPPLRVIQGDKTQMNWPAAMRLNPDTGELYVANDIGQSILVFSGVATAQGNVAPVRVLKGPKTRLSYPTGAFLDTKNQELWVSNLGNASATVYPLKANGDVAPLRIIRSAPEGKKSLNFGRTAAVAYDSNREQLLVPNWVNHPQIAAFARLAKENTPYVRSIEGQKSLLGRTMHDLAYDAIHDEIVVTSPLAQAILTFRGGATGEEAPIRVIQGSKTGILGVGAAGKLSIDPQNNEILLATPKNEIRVFAREAKGDVAPIRVLSGPDTQLQLGQQTTGGGNVPAIRVDPIHNLLIVPVSGQGGGQRGGQGGGQRGGQGGGFGSGAGNFGSGGKVLIFDRTASGNTKPRAVIQGPVRLGNQFEVYAPKSLMLTHSRDTLEVWRIPDSGESVNPLFRIPAPIGRSSSDTGIALDPLHKEVIIATAAGNTVMTFSVPEVFDAAPSSR